MDVTKHIICELTGYRPGTVDVSQGDRGSRVVSCRLLENGAPWMIPEGATARVAYTLPDGKDGLYDSRPDGTPMWEISKNIVTVELADQLMAQAGMVQMSILIIGPEGGQLATWPIRVMVCADNAARLTVPENLPPYGAGFAGKLFYGGADGTVTPLALGDGVEIVRQEDGSYALVACGGGAVAEHNASETAHPDIRRMLENLLPREELPEAIENALAQAKKSGEFDGPQGPQGAPGPAGAPGAPGDDYVLTDADRQEIAELAADMVKVPDVDIPTTLPNPKALTFTGAATGTYDGSAPLTVNIPEGGGGTPTAAEKIVDYTVDADSASATTFSFTVADYPKLAEYNHLRGIVRKSTNGGMPWVHISLTAANVSHHIGHLGASSYGMFGFEIMNNAGYYLGGTTSTFNPNAYNDWITASFPNISARRAFPLYLKELTMVSVLSYTTFLDAGGKIEIWGWND